MTSAFSLSSLEVLGILAASDLRETSVSVAGSFGTIVAGLVVNGLLAVTLDDLNSTFAGVSFVFWVLYDAGWVTVGAVGVGC